MILLAAASLSVTDAAALIAALIALLTFYSSQKGLLGKADSAHVKAEHDRISELQNRVTDLERELRDCKQEVSVRINENVELMRRILASRES